jgi:hypothetical protein
MTNRRSTLSLLCLAVLGSTLVHAQQPVNDPESLKTLRKGFHQGLIIASGSLNDFYARALATSESYYASKGDYEQARAIKARREDLAALGLIAANALPPTVNSIPLAVETARTYGVVSAKSGELVNWRSSSCAAEWTLSKFTPGTYQIQLIYTMTPKTPPTGTTKSGPEPAKTLNYVFKESSLLAAAATTKNECPIALETTKEATTLLSTGTIQLTRPPMNLRLAATASYPGNILVIRDIKLIQTTAPNAPTATKTTAPLRLGDELTKLRAELPDALAKARADAFDAYSKKLDQLVTASPKDESLATQAENEKRRAKKTLSNVAVKQTGTQESFDELDDVHFMLDPANTGDRFKVITKDGKEMHIRLALVSCAPSDPTAREMKTVTGKFGIDVDAAFNLAGDAQVFAAEYLQGRSLSLLIKPAKDKAEIPEALVFVANIGLFQNVLIDHGLAVVDVPPPATKSSTHESEYVQLVKERETQARKQTPRPGGWGLGNAKP